MSGETEGRQAAERFRVEHQLGTAPISDINDLADYIGVDIVYVNAADSEHGLLAKDTRSGASVIVANGGLPVARLRSTIAHEVCHYLHDEDLGMHDEFLYTSASETRANAFARHLLLPLKAVREARKACSELNNEELLNWCVRRYRVSPEIAAYQLNNAKIIGDEECAELKKYRTRDLAIRYGWRQELDDHSSDESRQRGGTRLKELATRAYLEGRLPAQELAAITGLSLDVITSDLASPACPLRADTDEDDLSNVGRLCTQY
ncbi:MAG: ImmA/IrrE family metallo-endopeptidase [Bowdeniella nasicola]|nr:ImmA/IrrE family metallo-endopeptidase [Bowdeniella nasicola]